MAALDVRLNRLWVIQLRGFPKPLDSTQLSQASVHTVIRMKNLEMNSPFRFHLSEVKFFLFLNPSPSSSVYINSLQLSARLFPYATAELTLPPPLAPRSLDKA